jgi:hypothetical protein
VKAALAAQPKPASNDPKDLAIAGAEAVAALAKAAGKTLDLTAPAPANNAQTGPLHATGQTSDSGGSSSTAIVLIVGGSVGLLVALVGLFWWVRRAPEDDAAADAGSG